MAQKTLWVISVRAGSQRKDIRIESLDNEITQDTYKRVKQRYLKIKEKVGGQATVEIISHTIAFKPKGTKPHKSWLWCPYCAKWRIFSPDDILGVDRCSICGISTKDFYVREYNHLWPTE